MTSERPTTPPGDHLDLDQLADHDEGLLTPGETAAADAHLTSCPDCQQRRADIRSTRELLATVPAEPMPDSVATRIDAALAAAGGPTTVVPFAAKRRGWRAHPTVAGLGAAAAVAALVSALVVGRTSNHPSTDQSGPQAGPGAAAAAPPALSLPPSSTSGTRYTPKNVDQTVGQLLAPQTTAMLAPESTASPAPEAGISKATTIPTSLSRLFSSPGALEACVRGVAAGGSGLPSTPLAIDFAHYAGAPAVLIVLPGLEPGRVDAWFVGPDCTSNDSHLLAYKSLPDPSSAPPAPPP